MCVTEEVVKASGGRNRVNEDKDMEYGKFASAFEYLVESFGNYSLPDLHARGPGRDWAGRGAREST